MRVVSSSVLSLYTSCRRSEFTLAIDFFTLFFTKIHWVALDTLDLSVRVQKLCDYEDFCENDLSGEFLGLEMSNSARRY
jgi:hypothetical protein